MSYNDIMYMLKEGVKMIISTKQYENLRILINTNKTKEALTLLNKVNDNDVVKQISRKYQEEITLLIYNMIKKEHVSIKCMKINNNIAIGKALFSNKYVVYHIKEKCHLGIIGTKKLIFSFIDELLKININLNDIQEIKHQYQTDGSKLNELIWKYKQLMN